jgi:hypothetical protein
VKSVSMGAENSEERWTRQIASFRRSYANAIVVVVSVIEKEPSNKPALFKPQLISCLGYPDK